jgi:hypothetical protein
MKANTAGAALPPGDDGWAEPKNRSGGRVLLISGQCALPENFLCFFKLLCESLRNP